MLLTYRYPNGASAPTLAQMKKKNTMVVDVTTDDGNVNESPVDITHNLALAPADGSDGRPDVLITKLVSAATVLCDLRVTYKDLNTITLTKIIGPSVAGASGVFRVIVKRPASPER
jgi:hypothetical protein